MTSPARVVVPIDSHDSSAWAHSVDYALAIGTKAQSPVSDYVLLTHTKQQLNHTSLASHVGAANAKALLANKDVGVQGGGRLRHATLQTLRGSVRDAIVIAYFAEEKMMETIDGPPCPAAPRRRGAGDRSSTSLPPHKRSAPRAARPSRRRLDGQLDRPTIALLIDARHNRSWQELPCLNFRRVRARRQDDIS